MAQSSRLHRTPPGPEVLRGRQVQPLVLVERRRVPHGEALAMACPQPGDDLAARRQRKSPAQGPAVLPDPADDGTPIAEPSDRLLAEPGVEELRRRRLR